MYDEHFYKMYGDYLNEPKVNKKHRWALRAMMKTALLNRVVDLGCGEYQEFKQSTYICHYLGLDENARHADFKCDYRSDKGFDFIKEFKPTGFVSLFSSEITAPYQENYNLYKKLFSLKTIEVGLVSGFYYIGSKENPITEAGGIISYQTLEPIEDTINSIFNEKRITMHVPSKLFGDQVIEVWKLFTRKSN